MTATQPFESIRQSCSNASAALGVKFHPECLKPYLQDEDTYDHAVRRAAAPRLPLSFPSTAHEINLLCVMALLDTPANAARYAAKANPSDDAWSDVVLRGCMAAYISSSSDDFASQSNLLGAKGLKWPAEKLAELFSLTLSEMHETDHPTMPAVKVGERREGRHAELVKSLAASLARVCQRLDQAGYSSAGDIVVKEFEAAKEQGEEGATSVVAKLLEVLPELGETHNTDCGAIVLHAPLIQLSNNILALLDRAEDGFGVETGLVLPAAPDLKSAQGASGVGLLDLSNASSATGKRLQGIATGARAGEDSSDAALLRAATVAACDNVAAWAGRQPTKPEWHSKITAFGIGALLDTIPAPATSSGLDL